MPLPIDLSSLTAMSKMSDRQFSDFCRTNPDLRIERNANGEIIVIPQHLPILATAMVGYLGSFLSGLKPTRLEKPLILVRALLYPMVQFALQTQHGFCPIVGMLYHQNNKHLLPRSFPIL
jgi:hypothetical protein